MKLYVIPCTFSMSKDSGPQKGLAICEDPDTPVTFLYDTGEPYTNLTMYSFELHHHEPWSAHDI